MEFIPFDYQNPPADGHYWVAGKRPVCDVDADDTGAISGSYTGEQESFVALVWIDLDADGYVSFESVDRHNFGCVNEDDAVTHCARFEVPSPPGA